MAPDEFNHSTLNHLPLIGLGSIEIVSFTSYLSLLAKSHSLPLHALLSQMVVPRLRKSATYSKSQESYGQLTAHWWQYCSPTLNGLAASTREWVSVLENLTLSNDLSQLTMLKWANILSWLRLIRRHKAWCPVCYSEWLRAGQDIYDPILWSLEVVQICHHHGICLQFRCPFPDCNRMLPVLNPKSFPGFCPYCNCWLGLNLENAISCYVDVVSGHDELETQYWVIDSIGQLLTTTANPPQAGDLATRISAIYRNEFEDNWSQFSHYLGLARKTIQELCQGTQLPQLETLLRICGRVRCSPLELIYGSDSPSHINQKHLPQISLPVAKPARRRRAFNVEQVSEVLSSSLHDENNPPQPLRALAKQLDYDSSHIQRKLRPLSRAVSQRYLRYRQRLKSLRKVRLQEIVRKNVLDADSEG